MQYKGKEIVNVPSSGTKYLPVTVHSVNEQKDMAVTDINVITDSVYAQISDGTYFWSEVKGPTIESYLSFIEENDEPFTLKTANASKNWDGTLYYSTDTEKWSEWDGTEISSSNDGKLYLSGKGNTRISDCEKQFVLSDGKHIQCQGNIETILDYETVEQKSHPVMAEGCYKYMFYKCTSLTKAPELPATTLTAGCYNSMFRICTSLTQAPELPATTLASECYYFMFGICHSLTQAPELPATTLASGCYGHMFYGCTSLTPAPDLPATTLADECYSSMFSGCHSLTEAPELPATTLAYGCYRSMFFDCTSLTQAPKLPATTLTEWCYYGMFQNCTSLAKAPDLPATTLTNYCYSVMFYNCNSLTGQVHCARSTASNNYRLTANDITGSSATIVFNL